MPLTEEKLIRNAVAFRWWVCPGCHHAFLFLFSDGELSHLPLDFQCKCGRGPFPTPWPDAHTRTIICKWCGFAQSRLAEPKDADFHCLRSGRTGSAYLMQSDCWACHRAVTGRSFFEELGSALWGASSSSVQDAQLRSRLDALAAGEIKLRQAISGLDLRRADIARQREAREKSRQAALGCLDGLVKLSPVDFERAVAGLFRALGWTAYSTARSADHGIDLVLVRESGTAAVQCKRFRGVVSEPRVREFYGALHGRFSKGFFVTTSSFTGPARQWAKTRKKLMLIDGEKLVESFIAKKPTDLSPPEQWTGRL